MLLIKFLHALYMYFDLNYFKLNSPALSFLACILIPWHKSTNNRVFFHLLTHSSQIMSQSNQHYPRQKISYIGNLEGHLIYLQTITL